MLEPEPVGGPAPKALKITKETLTKFKKQLDDAITALDASPASNTQVSRQTLSSNTYGEGFAEADDLADAYNQVHDNLKNLSQSLGDQLEALSLAVECAHKGYDNADEEQVQRLRKLQQQTQQGYVKYQQKHGHQPKAHGGDQLGGDAL